MLFNSGTPSLVGWTRNLIGDPTTAASEQWDTTTEIKPALNREYLFLREIARTYGMGATTKRTYATGVANQLYYQRPADIVKLEAIEVSGNGSNLATAAVSSSDIIYPSPWPVEKALQAYNTGRVTEVAEYFGLQDDHFLIVAPLTATEAGTNSIRILYEASTTELSGDTDEPELPRPFHDLICYRAAISLKIMRDMDYSDLAAYASNREQQFRVAMQDSISMHEDVIPVQGLRSPSITRQTVLSGTVRRTIRGSSDNDVYP